MAMNTVLVVGAVGSQRLLLTTILRSAGYDNIRLAATAWEAMVCFGLGDSDEIRETDLVLMDASLPDMDGIEACRIIKGTPLGRDVPIIMLTASTEPATLQAAFDAAATDYLTKPVRSVELLARVRAALRLKHEMDGRKAREDELMAMTRQLQTTVRSLRERERDLLQTQQKLERVNRRLRDLSNLDGLTGIANRRQFDELLHTAWAQSQASGEPLALVMIDVDCFKRYNDTYGHLQGDDCLRRVARALASGLRGPNHHVARYGGEEFALLLPNTTPGEAFEVAERLRMAVTGLAIEHRSSLVSHVVTISVGVAVALIGDMPPLASTGQLIVEADQALYQAKAQGRNCVRIFEQLPAHL